MKKIILFVFSMLLAVSAFAGTVYVPFRDTGIITPDIATGFHRTGRFTTSGSGDILVCRDLHSHSWVDNTCTYHGYNAWVLMTNIAPAGKTYVGFTVINNTLTIYWK